MKKFAFLAAGVIATCGLVSPSAFAQRAQTHGAASTATDAISGLQMEAGVDFSCAVTNSGDTVEMSVEDDALEVNETITLVTNAADDTDVQVDVGEAVLPSGTAEVKIGSDKANGISDGETGSFTVESATEGNLTLTAEVSNATEYGDYMIPLTVTCLFGGD